MLTRPVHDFLMWLTRIFSATLLAMAMALSATAAEKSAPVTEPAPATLEQRVNNLEHMMQSQGLLDMLQQLQALKSEIRKLEGQIEVNTHTLEQLQNKADSQYHDVDERLKKLENKNVAQTTSPAETAPPLEVIPATAPVEPVGTKADSSLTVENVPQTGTAPAATPPAASTSPAAAPPPAGATPATTAPASTNPQDNATATGNATQEQTSSAEADPLAAQADYQQAFNLLKQSQYEKAIAAFTAFLGKYPQSQYSDNAQYWIGEIYFVTRRFNDAITEYMKLLTNYPQSQKAPNSLLKIGYSYYELKQDAEAKKVLQDLIQRYPGTAAAQDAQKRLQP